MTASSPSQNISKYQTRQSKQNPVPISARTSTNTYFDFCMNFSILPLGAYNQNFGNLTSKRTHRLHQEGRILGTPHFLLKIYAQIWKGENYLKHTPKTTLKLCHQHSTDLSYHLLFYHVHYYSEPLNFQ